MKSALTEERLMMRDSARRFAMERVLPLANELDPKKEQMPQSLIDEMGEMGYFGMMMSQEYGGLGLGCFEYCLVAEEMSRAWMSVAGLMARGNILDERFLTEEQRQRFLPRIARGELLGAFALSEPNAGSDAANIS